MDGVAERRIACVADRGRPMGAATRRPFELGSARSGTPDALDAGPCRARPLLRAFLRHDRDLRQARASRSRGPIAAGYRVAITEDCDAQGRAQYRGAVRVEGAPAGDLERRPRRVRQSCGSGDGGGGPPALLRRVGAFPAAGPRARRGGRRSPGRDQGVCAGSPMANPHQHGGCFRAADAIGSELLRRLCEFHVRFAGAARDARTCCRRSIGPPATSAEPTSWASSARRPSRTASWSAPGECSKSPR